jgi:hypothetical protein
MKTRRRNVMQSAPASDEDPQYCVYCEAARPFERVEAGDHPVDDPAGEWICVSCGSALLVGTLPQHLDRTA